MDDCICTTGVGRRVENAVFTAKQAYRAAAALAVLGLGSLTMYWVIRAVAYVSDLAGRIGRAALATDTTVLLQGLLMGVVGSAVMLVVCRELLYLVAGMGFECYTARMLRYLVHKTRVMVMTNDLRKRRSHPLMAKTPEEITREGLAHHPGVKIDPEELMAWYEAMTSVQRGRAQHMTEESKKFADRVLSEISSAQLN